MHRLLSAGHTGVMDYGLAWFHACLDAAARADQAEAKRERYRRAALVVDVNQAVHGDKKNIESHVNRLLRG